MGQTAKPKILIIDDEPALVEVIQESLADEGMETVAAYDAQSGLRLFFQTRPDLVVLDIVMPGCDGWEVCRRLRQVSNLPILMLTAKSDSADLLRGLQMGADDYVTKPFSLAVFRARIEALLRRAARHGAGAQHERFFREGDVSVDMLTRKVTIDDRAIALTPKEFDLLAYMVRHAGRTIPHQELLQQVWGPEYQSDTRYLSLYIWYLRNRIEENPRKPQRILTWRGLGYRFVPTAQSDS